MPLSVAIALFAQSVMIGLLAISNLRRLKKQRERIARYDRLVPPTRSDQ